MKAPSVFSAARLAFHADLLKHVLTRDKIGSAVSRARMAGQTSGNHFEALCTPFRRRAPASPFEERLKL